MRMGAPGRFEDAARLADIARLESSRPASAAAGTRSGASFTASSASGGASPDRVPRPRAHGRSTARRADGGRPACRSGRLRSCDRAPSNAPFQSPAAQRNSSTACAGPAGGRRASQPLPRRRRCAAGMSPRRCASMNRPCRPSSLVSAASAMARNASSAAGRSPASCAVCAASSSVSGSSAAKRRASAVNARGTRRSPAPTAISPAVWR